MDEQTQLFLQVPKQEMEESQKIKMYARLIAYKTNKSRPIRHENDRAQTQIKSSKSNLDSYSNKLNLSGSTSPNYSKEKNEQDLQSLDISDMLKTVSHQKKAFNEKRRLEMSRIHHQTQLLQDDYKYFIMICSQANYRKLEYPGYYKNLLKYVTTYPEAFFVCINKDIPRTMPDDHPLQQSLRNVLYAYAIRNPSLLYCQGMNYLVGFLLINKFSEQQTFWCLVQLIQQIVLPQYFKDLSTISVAVQIFEDVIAQAFPQFFEQMQQVGMESGIFLVGWYICLFTKGFINSVSQYLLQYIILESYQYPIGFTLIKISLGLFATLFTREQRFEYQQKDFKSLKQSIENNVFEISLDQLKSGLRYFTFRYDSYSKLLSIYNKKRELNFQKALEKQLNQKKLILPHCNPEQPVCIQRVQIERKVGSLQQVLILKNNIPIQKQYIKNYFQKVNKMQPKISYDQPDECPITHHSHVCQISTTKHKLMPNKKLKQQNQKYEPNNQKQAKISIEIKSRFSKIEDKFSEYSGFFIVDDNNANNFLDEDDENQENLILGTGNVKQFKQEGKQNKSYNSFVASMNNAFQKVLKGITMLKSGINKENEDNEGLEQFNDTNNQITP